MYAAEGSTLRRAMAARATSRNLSKRYGREPASVAQVKRPMVPETGAVVANIEPVWRIEPVMMRVQIAVLTWSPMIAPRKVSPVRSLGPSGVARQMISE